MLDGTSEHRRGKGTELRPIDTALILFMRLSRVLAGITARGRFPDVNSISRRRRSSLSPTEKSLARRDRIGATWINCRFALESSISSPNSFNFSYRSAIVEYALLFTVICKRYVYLWVLHFTSRAHTFICTYIFSILFISRGCLKGQVSTFQRASRGPHVDDRAGVCSPRDHHSRNQR